MSPARPSLLPVAAFVSLLVLLLGATGLFALHHTNEKTAADLARLDATEDALLLAVRARASFKTQVQEWKNILLRGRSPADLADYRARFEAEEALVAAELARLVRRLPEIAPPADAPALSVASVEALAAEHARLGETYRAALAAHDFSADPEAAFRIDASVRGLDRALSDQLDALAATFEQLTTAELRSLTERATARYEALRRITWIVASLAVLASLWLCFRATRLTA